MDFIAPPMFDILNFQTWKVKMSMYLKALRIYVYFTTIKDSYFINGKYLEANTKVIYALKSTQVMMIYLGLPTLIQLL